MNLYKIIDETKKIINPLHLKFNNEKKKKNLIETASYVSPIES